MKTFNVIEDRGYGVKYTIFSGSLDDCQIWMHLNTKEHPSNPDIRIHIDEENVNGNGEPFTYTVEEED